MTYKKFVKNCLMLIKSNDLDMLDALLKKYPEYAKRLKEGKSE